MNSIEEIYCNLESLTDDKQMMEDTSEVKTAGYEYMSELEKLNLPKDKEINLDNLIGVYVGANEKQSFVRGFRYAFGLIKEL